MVDGIVVAFIVAPVLAFFAGLGKAKILDLALILLGFASCGLGLGALQMFIILFGYPQIIDPFLGFGFAVGCVFAIIVFMSAQNDYKKWVGTRGLADDERFAQVRLGFFGWIYRFFGL